jgi:hypothetical protein
MEKRKAGAEFYVERGNSRANEIIVGGLGKFGLSDEYYGGEKILVWKVSLGFIKELYKDKAQWPKLEFRIFIEIDGSLRRWELFRPDFKRKAAAMKKIGKGGKNAKSDG